MPALWTQSYPPRPHFTDKDVESQTGRVCVVTGGATGVGYHVASILYRAGATVYVAGRSKEKATKAIAQIKNEHKSSQGKIDFIFLDLSDLATVKSAAQAIQARESHIDILFNNAGIGAEVGGVRSAQDIEIHYATNCIGPLLLTRLLQRQLETTEHGPARVIWTASLTVDFDAPTGGLDLTNLEHPRDKGARTYSCSKVGNWFIASELARREVLAAQTRGGGDGSQTPRVLHLVINPGNLRTPIWRYVNWLFVQILNWTSLYPAEYGAYTALWAGLSPDIRPQDAGRYIIPWGRWHPQPREDILRSLKSPEEGGTGVARKFVEWCERKFEMYE